jgi:hypothetical protein
MPIDFPASPTNGQTYTFANRTWQFDGKGWVVVFASADENALTIHLVAEVFG